MKASEIKERISASTISKKGDVYTARWGYYWGITKSGETKKNLVEEMIHDATVLDYGNHYAPFRGGASVGKQSHFWVKFTMKK